MPELPTLTVTQEQADRMLAAFGSVAEYKAWLRQQIINYVVAKEAIAYQALFVESQTQRERQTRQELE